jgi:hypothetical protein
MSYKNKKSLKNELNEKNLNEYYNKKKFLIMCPYCSNILNLYTINTHLNNSKKCIILQEVKNKIDPELKFNEKYILLIGKFKQLYKLVNNYEDDITKKEYINRLECDIKQSKIELSLNN